MNKRKIGDTKELLAKAYLEKEGYLILEKNFRCKMGEIDLIGKDNDNLVFIEVKYRKNHLKGHPLESVNAHKQQRIIRTAQYYMAKHGYSFYTSCRFDVIGLMDDTYILIKDAFIT